MLEKSTKCIRLLSLDAGGGARSFSQLEILKNVMHRVQYELYPNDPDKVVLPCDYFDMIGGTDTGGLLALMFVSLHMSVDEVMEEFARLCEQVYNGKSLDTTTRSNNLRSYLTDMMERREFAVDLKLAQSQRDRRSKGFAMATLRDDLQAKVKFRTYRHKSASSLDITIIDAMMATCASRSYFDPVTTGASFRRKTYTSGPPSCMNPIREVITEACEVLPNADGLYVAALLSLGAGHPGIISAPMSNKDQNQWAQVLQSLLSDCEQVAGDMFRQLSRLGIYHRFSVTRGLEISSSGEIFDIESIYSQTGSYCESPEVMEKLDDCVKSLQSSIGVVNISQLKYSGGGVVAHKSLPAITSNFVMRQEPWRRLLEGLILDTDVNLQRVVVVSGMGGCGKTQLCAKFIQQHSFGFDHTFSIDGSSASSIQADLVSHIRSLGPKNSQAVLEDALLYLSDPRNTRWLLFIDNVDDVEINLATFLPDCNHGCILVTTRNRHLGRLASKAEWHLELDVMSENEAVSLLQNAVSRSQPVEDQKKLPEVAEALGCLPVALAQAGAYMYENLCSPEDYLRLYKQRHDQLLKYEGHSRHKANAYAAFEVSFRRLPPEVQDFLYITSHYHFSGFPIAAFDHAGTSGFRREPFEYQRRESVFEESVSLLKFIFFTGDRWADESMHKIIRLLQSYSMASFTSGFKTKFLRMHPLFHDWVFDRISDEKRSLFLSAAARVLTCAQGERRMDTQLLPHILFVLSSPGAKLLHINDRASLSWSVGERGDPEYAKTLWTDIYETVSKLESSQSLALASASAELGGLYSDDLSRMAELEQKALQIYEFLLGPDHEKTDTMFLDLGSTYERQGNHEKAEEMYNHVIERRGEKFGEDDLTALEAMKRLADYHYSRNQHSAAEPLYANVLLRRRKILGDDHDDTLWTMTDLVATYSELGRHSEEEELGAEYVRLLVEKLGEYHEHTLLGLRELALAYRSLGQYSKAQELDTEWVRRHREKLGENHEETLEAMHSIALEYYNESQYSKAEEMQIETVKGRKEKLGEDHNATLTSVHLLALIYQCQNRFPEAEMLYKDLLRLRKAKHGDGHDDVLYTMHDLAKVYDWEGRHTEAAELKEARLEHQKKKLGEDNIELTRSRSDLATTYLNMGRHSEAEDLQRMVIKQQKQILGDGHQGVFSSLCQLAEIYMAQNRNQDAEALIMDASTQWKENHGGYHFEILASLHDVALKFYNSGHYGPAEDLLNEVIRAQKEILGEGHPDTRSSMHLLAFTYECQGRYSDAEALYKDSLSKIKDKPDANPHDIISTMDCLLKLLENQDRHSEAADIKAERIEQQKRMLGDGHIDVLRSMHDLAGIYFDLNRYSDAEVLAVDVVKERAEHQGGDHLDTLSSMHLLARLHQAQGRYAEAEALHKEVLMKWKDKFGEYHVDTLGSLHELAVTYYNAGLFSEVERLGTEVIKAQKERLGEDNPSTLLSVHLLAKAYQDQDRYSDAEELEVDLVQRQRKQLGDEHHDTLRSIYDLAWNYWRQGRYSDAKQLASELLETRRRVFGEDHPDTVSARDLLNGLNASREERSEVDPSV